MNLHELVTTNLTHMSLSLSTEHFREHVLVGRLCVTGTTFNWFSVCSKICSCAAQLATAPSLANAAVSAPVVLTQLQLMLIMRKSLKLDVIRHVRYHQLPHASYQMLAQLT